MFVMILKHFPPRSPIPTTMWGMRCSARRSALARSCRALVARRRPQRQPQAQRAEPEARSPSRTGTAPRRWRWRLPPRRWRCRLSWLCPFDFEEVQKMASRSSRISVFVSRLTCSEIPCLLTCVSTVTNSKRERFPSGSATRWEGGPRRPKRPASQRPPGEGDYRPRVQYGKPRGAEGSECRYQPASYPNPSSTKTGLARRSPRKHMQKRSLAEHAQSTRKATRPNERWQDERKEEQ